MPPCLSLAWHALPIVPLGRYMPDRPARHQRVVYKYKYKYMSKKQKHALAIVPHGRHMLDCPARHQGIGGGKPFLIQVNMDMDMDEYLCKVTETKVAAAVKYCLNKEPIGSSIGGMRTNH